MTFKKFLTILGLLLFIELNAAYSIAELYPQASPPEVVQVVQGIDFARLSGTISQIDEDSNMVSLIEALDAQLYSRQVHHLVVFPKQTDWTFLVVTGEKAAALRHKMGAFAVTIPMWKLVILLDTPGANRWLILAHEFTHVLQTEDGTISTRDKIYFEYQAEINSRLIIGLFENFTLPSKLDTKPLTPIDEFNAIKLLVEFF